MRSPHLVIRLHEMGRNNRQNYFRIGQPKASGLNLNALATLINRSNSGLTIALRLAERSLELGRNYAI
jgi:hypothetical protein